MSDKGLVAVTKVTANRDCVPLTLLERSVISIANKTKKLCFRVNESDCTLISEKAAKANMSLSSYLATAALDKRIVVIDELKSILPQLRKLGVNLNQLTVLCHQGRITCPDLTSVEKELSSIWRLLTSLTDKIRR